MQGAFHVMEGGGATLSVYPRCARAVSGTWDLGFGTSRLPLTLGVTCTPYEILYACYLVATYL